MKEEEEEEAEDNGEVLRVSLEKGDEFYDKLTGDSIGIPPQYKTNRFFTNFYFWVFYIFIISSFYDIFLYISYYKEKTGNGKIYKIIIFYGRIISDILMVIPNFLFTNYSIYIYRQFKIALLGLLCFLPQLIINTINLLFIYFIEESMKDVNEKLFLIISTVTNTFLNLLCSFFSIIKVIFNY